MVMDWFAVSTVLESFLSKQKAYFYHFKENLRVEEFNIRYMFSSYHMQSHTKSDYTRIYTITNSKCLLLTGSHEFIELVEIVKMIRFKGRFAYLYMYEGNPLIACEHRQLACEHLMIGWHIWLACEHFASNTNKFHQNYMHLWSIEL